MPQFYNLEFLRDYFEDDEESMKSILQLYADETPGQLRNIEEKLQEKKATEVKAATHKMKTNVAMLGIPNTGNYLDKIGTLDASDEITPDIVAQFTQFKTGIMNALEEIKRDFSLR